MFKHNYSIQAPNTMAWQMMRLTAKQAEQLRRQGYTVER